jgi:hypothetical protein
MVEMLTPQDVSRITCLSLETPAQWRSKKIHLPYLKIGRLFRFDRAQDAYCERMKTATFDRANDLTGAADAGAAIPSAGARRGNGITVGGYNQAYGLNLQGNRINYEGAVKAAAQARDATIEAAKLRAVVAVVSSVGHNIARDMEQGVTLRY